MITNKVLSFKNCLVLVLSLQKRTLASKSNIVENVLKEWTSKFEHEKIPEPENSVQHIVAHVLNTKSINEMELHKHEELNSVELEKINKLCECRLARMPVQYIIKEWDFRDLTLKMVPPVFIPRPETEELIDIVTNHFENSNTSPSTMVEIGPGTGAISISLLKHFPKLKCLAIDRSEFACNLTRENAVTHNVADRLNVVHSEIDSKGQIKNLSKELLNDKFDLIVSNPPYIPSLEIPKLEPEVSLYEDIKALDGGHDGLNIIKPICVFASNYLKPNGSVFLETNHDHEDKIKEWLKLCQNHMRMHFEKYYKDIHDRSRFVHVKYVE